MTKPLRAPHVTRAVMMRAMKLLYMEYKPSEMAEVIGVTAKTIYDTYIPNGLPHRRDAGGGIWIVGTQFVEWANAVLEKGERYAAQRKIRLKDNQGYCVKCKTGRDFRGNPKRETYSKNRTLLRGHCSVCGGKMATFKKGLG